MFCNLAKYLCCKKEEKTFETQEIKINLIKRIPWEPEPRIQDWTWWWDMHKSFVKITQRNFESIQAIFYGDSITDWWGTTGIDTFSKYYASIGTANYGIAGDRTEHVLWRIQNGEITDQLNPKVCVLQIGTNNIGVNDAQEIAMGIRSIVLELREMLPNMKILLVGVLPRVNEKQTKITSEINSIISTYDDGKNIRYLDMKDSFYFGGDNLNKVLYADDLLHLSADGYRKWAGVMESLFRELFQ